MSGMIQRLRQIPGEFSGAVGQEVDDSVVVSFEEFAVDAPVFCVRLNVGDPPKPRIGRIQRNRVDLTAQLRQPWKQILSHRPGRAEHQHFSGNVHFSLYWK